MTPIPEAVIEILRRPLPPEAIKPHPTKKFLSTIKAIYVVERLNEAFGLNGWKVKNELVELHETKIQTKDGNEKLITMVVMKSFLTVPEYGIEVEAYGGNDNEDRGDAYKGACTDALTKICSYIYVGMNVYKGIKSPINGWGDSGSQAAADQVAQDKIAAMSAEAKTKKSKAFYNLMKSFKDIKTRLQAMGLEDAYYDHLHRAGKNHSNQFTDDEEGFNAARACFRSMSEELSELEVAAKKASD